MKRIKPIATRRSQQGITLVLISLILLILIGMGAFAMDLSHQVLNKARLQNAVDSAALASALVADQTSDVELAEQAAIDALNSFVTPEDDLPDGVVFGNKELVFTQENNITVTFSKDKQTFFDADTFTFGDDSDIYVRVAVSDVSLTQYLSHIFGVGKNVSASAVAGPSAAITSTCNVSPVGMCGDSSSTELAWGYIPADNPDYDAKTDRDDSTIHVLKPPSHQDGGIGPGNYHLLDFGQGGSTVRELFAGKSDTCIAVGEVINTQPGKEAGPVTQGLNTRFEGGTIGTGQEQEIVKADKYLEQSNVTYENYKTVYQYSDDVSQYPDTAEYNNAKAFYYADYYSALTYCESVEGACDNNEFYNSLGQEDRRVLRVPIVNCNGATGSGTESLTVLGLGCFFVTQEVVQSDSIIFGQFIDTCAVQNASTGVNPTDSIGPYKIQLYKDPLSGDS